MDERLMKTKENIKANILFDKCVGFLRAIGIPVHFRPIANDSFLPGISIDKGEIVVDMEKLKYPGDILHEAGHIAVISKEERFLLSGNITENRPGSEGEEMSVMLWTYAACLELNIPAELVFHTDGYKGESQWIIDQYRNGNYIGLPLLVWMGLAHDAKEEEGFPKMIKWLK
jgi:hypothetical protein